MDISTTLGLVAATLASGLPALATQFAATGALLLLGTLLYKLVSPFDDDALVKSGNVAAAILLTGAVIALAIPLAATLAGQRSVLDILVWGLVALVIQVATFYILLSRRWVREGIPAGNVAVAIATVGAQVAVALVNAGAMLG